MKAFAIGSGLLLAYLVGRLANFVFNLAGELVRYVVRLPMRLIDFALQLAAGLVHLALALGLVAAILYGAMHAEEVMRITSSWIGNW